MPIRLCLIAALFAFGRSANAQHATRRLLVLGNSLAYSPGYPEGGWFFHWGMAATSEDRDYAHVLARMLTEKLGGYVGVAAAVYMPQIEWNYATYPITSVQPYRDMNADYIVIQFGTNVDGDESHFQHDVFVAKFIELIQYVRVRPDQIIVCTDSFHRSPIVSAALREACDAERFVATEDLSDAPENLARAQGVFTDLAVGAHPSDLGMQRIAERMLAGFVHSYYVPFAPLNPAQKIP